MLKCAIHLLQSVSIQYHAHFVRWYTFGTALQTPWTHSMWFSYTGSSFLPPWHTANSSVFQMKHLLWVLETIGFVLGLKSMATRWCPVLGCPHVRDTHVLFLYTLCFCNQPLPLPSAYVQAFGFYVFLMVFNIICIYIYISIFYIHQYIIYLFICQIIIICYFIAFY